MDGIQQFWLCGTRNIFPQQAPNAAVVSLQRPRGLKFWIDSPCDQNIHLSCGTTTAVKTPEIDPIPLVEESACATPCPRLYASLVALGDGKSCTRTEWPVNKFNYLWTLLRSGGESGSQISARDLLKRWRERGGRAPLWRFKICSCLRKIRAKGKSSSLGWLWFGFMDLRDP